MTLDPLLDHPVADLLEDGLRGHPCHVEGLGPEPLLVPVDVWSSAATTHDEALLALCRGATLDVGCGPGRMAHRLTERGHAVLAIDVLQEAVDRTRARGAAAVRQDVFDPVPAEGLWDTALLADGNIGIGGDPTLLLRRLRGVVRPGGRVVADLSGPGAGVRRVQLRLVVGGRRSEPFSWAVVGAGAVGGLAATAGLEVEAVREVGGCWAAVLRRPW
jgi:SAM-dependent methyltransferase